MILDSTLRKLQVVLTTAQTTAPMSVVVDWVDNTTTTFTPGVTPTVTNGTTAVDILPAPAAATQRKVNGITISNKDSVSKVVQVYLNDNGTQYSLTSSTLGVGETLGYTDTQGWYTIDTSGARKGVGPIGATGSQGIQGVSGFHGWDGDNGEDAIPIPGPRGLQGIQGPPGPQGRTIIMLDDSDHGDPFPMGGGSAKETGPSGAAFSAYNSSVTSLANNLFTKVSFQTEEFDTTNSFDSVTNFRFQPAIAGYYQVNGCVGTVQTAGILISSIFKNGGEFKRGAAVPGNGVASVSSVFALVFLNGNTDFLEIAAFHTAGFSVNTSNSLLSTYFQAFLVRTA